MGEDDFWGGGHKVVHQFSWNIVQQPIIGALEVGKCSPDSWCADVSTLLFWAALIGLKDVCDLLLQDKTDIFCYKYLRSNWMLVFHKNL